MGLNGSYYVFKGCGSRRCSSLSLSLSLSLWFSLQNNCSRGTNQYPKELPSTYSMLCTHRVEYKSHTRRASRNNQDTDTNAQLSFLLGGSKFRWEHPQKYRVFQVQKKGTLRKSMLYYRCRC